MLWKVCRFLMCTMARASTSPSKIQDQSSMHAKHMMLRLSEELCNDSPFPSRAFAEFEQLPDLQTFSLLVSEEDLQQESSTATGHDLEKTIFRESTSPLLHNVSARASEIAHIMQGRFGSYASNGQHLPVPHASIERGLSGNFGSLAFNELSDFWGDIRLYSQEMATAAMFPPQKLERNEASTSCTTSGDPVTATASVEYDRPPGRWNRSSSIPPWTETSAGEGNDIECPRLQRAEDSKPWPLVTFGTAVDLDPTLIHRGPTRPLKSVDVARHLSSSCQPETPERTISPSLQPLSSRRTRFLTQSLPRSRLQDAAVVEQVTDTVVDSMASGTRQNNFSEQSRSVSMSRSPDIDRRRKAGECGTGGKANHFINDNLSPLKLKQKSNQLSVGRPAPRRYQRLRAVSGNDMEINSIQTPLDHVQRERQRRDVMTSKIAALELLLPKGPKRDRVSIVYDAIHLVKRSERDVKVLQRRLHDLKESRKSSLARSRQSIPKSIDCKMGTRGSYFVKGIGNYMKPVVIRTNPTWGESGNSKPRQRSSMISSAQCLEEGNILERGNVFVEFHVNLDDSVTIQEEKLVKCRCRMNYLSMMMGVVDEFRLDVTSCNIMKLCGYLLCIVALKTRTRREKITAAQFAIRLQSVVLDVDIPGEVTIKSIGLKSPKA